MPFPPPLPILWKRKGNKRSRKPRTLQFLSRRDFHCIIVKGKCPVLLVIANRRFRHMLQHQEYGKVSCACSVPIAPAPSSTVAVPVKVASKSTGIGPTVPAVLMVLAGAMLMVGA